MLAAIALAAALAGAGFAIRDRIAALGELFADQGIAGVYYRLKDKVPGAPANVRWESAEPEQQGFRAAALDDLWRRIGRGGAAGAWRSGR